MKSTVCGAALAAFLTATAALAGAVEARYPDGTLRATYVVNDRGLMHGPYIEYHPNGEVKVRGAYVNGRRSGTWVEYDDTGAVVASQSYNEVPATPLAATTHAQTTGLRVITSGTDVEVVVDGRSLGAHDTIVVPLPEGRHRVTGRRHGSFDDIESETVESGTGLNEVSLTPRRMRVEFSPRLGVMVADGQVSGPVLCLTAGFRTVRRSWGALLMTKIPPHPGWSASSHFVVGAHYTFANVCTPHVILETGVSAGYCRSARMVEEPLEQPYYPYTGYTTHVKHVSRRAVIGPRLLLHLGGEVFKFVLGAEYLLICDDWVSFESPRNLLAAYGGFALGL